MRDASGLLMELLANEDQIQFLVERRFGRFPRNADGQVVLGSRVYASMREAMEAYRAELMDMGSEKREALYRAELTKQQDEESAKAELAEAQRFFNQARAVADKNHWSRAAFWSLDEATALSLGREPKLVKWENVQEYTQASPFAHKYERLRDLILRAQQARQLTDPTPPGFYIAWARRNDVDFPADLEAAVVARGRQIGDWKSKYDELSSVYDALLSQLDKLLQQVQIDQEIKRNLQERTAQLEATLNAAPKPDFGLHGKERESVLRLIIGMAVAGYGYDPRATRSKEVSEIASDLTRAGVPLTDDTVRKWLKAAAELLPPAEPE
jgi:hypothetical protein